MFTIQSPGGEIHYCYDLSEKNPYIKNSLTKNDEEANTDPLIYLTERDINNAHYLESKNIYIRLLVLMDFLFNFYIYLTNDCYTINLFISGICFTGYISAHTYNKCGFGLYLGYQYVNTTINILYTIIFIEATICLNYNNYDINCLSLLSYFHPIDRLKIYPGTIIILVFTTLIQILINYYMQSYYNSFPKLRNLYIQ